ncbi:MAG: hypothetical protein GTO45_35610 [Candidatus Aminicenantes bacterium]|nr:hypothetical protein [Candidatus Aminicenantes bacterium]NIM84004.1 hypothetical protein [Candidatus Aminicenantes bacterium]NIN23482.1 hypothetical protein [Candidatus Aminicenantes bacterium]NIN47187.1 hypothetical protein [Candidatus Aminicenantes bacterium]NIN90111.1 hypothetical protein [Candidatus Aminicenantes bacterium]
MTGSKDTDEKVNNDTIRLGGDTGRIEMVEEIAQLAFIPEIQEYFRGALTTAKSQFRDKINEYRNIQLNLGKESKGKEKTESKEDLPELPEPLKKSKTYFFELSRVEDSQSGSPRWEVGKFKLQANEKTVNMIFSDFIREVDEYEIAPHRIQENTVYSPPLDKWFQTKFTKSSHTRVVVFVKEVEKVGKKGKKEEKRCQAKFNGGLGGRRGGEKK